MHVVKMQPLDTDRAQQRGKFGELGRQREVDREALAGARPIELDGVVGSRLEIEHLAARREKGCQVVHVAADSAAPRMGNEQQRTGGRLGQSQQIDASREWTAGVADQSFRFLVGVGRIELGECELGAAGQFVRFARAERRVTGMTDEHIAGKDVPEPGAACAQAEIDFDAVVAAQRGRVERADHIEAVAAKVKAWPGYGRHHGRSSRIGAREQRIEHGDGHSRRQRVVAAWNRIGRRARVVGKGADDANSPGIAARDQPVKPIVRDFGVGLQYDRVTVAMQRERAIHGGGIALMDRLLDQCRVASIRQFAQVSRELRLRRPIVDDDQFK